jgi:uracil DNA glycosylase
LEAPARQGALAGKDLAANRAACEADSNNYAHVANVASHVAAHRGAHNVMVIGADPYQKYIDVRGIGGSPHQKYKFPPEFARYSSEFDKNRPQFR